MPNDICSEILEERTQTAKIFVVGVVRILPGPQGKGYNLQSTGLQQIPVRTNQDPYLKCESSGAPELRSESLFREIDIYNSHLQFFHQFPIHVRVKKLLGMEGRNSYDDEELPRAEAYPDVQTKCQRGPIGALA